MADINSMSPQSGRMIKEDETIINRADIWAAIFDVVNGSIKVSPKLEVGDISIGAVEVKDKDNEDRLKINEGGSVDIKRLIDALPSGSNLIGRTGYQLKKISNSFIRPDNTTQYTIGDAITNSTSAPALFELDLSTIGAVNGQSVEIRKVAVVSSAKQSTLPLFNVYLSPTTFTPTNDNSALDIDNAKMELGGAWFACGTQNYTVSNSIVSVTRSEPIVLESDDTKLYGTIQAVNAYVPTSTEKFTIIAWVALL